jgi:hypothetical protein
LRRHMRLSDAQLDSVLPGAPAALPDLL